jgi:hypothetical protein
MVRDGAEPVPVIVDFGSIQRLSSGTDWALTLPTVFGAVAPWGNRNHVAPELLAEFALAKAEGRPASLRFDKQPVFELGVLAFEILGGLHPIDGYPHVAVDWALAAPPSGGAYTIQDLPAVYPTTLKGLCRTMVAGDPHARPELAEAVDALVRMLRSLRPPPSAGVGEVRVFFVGVFSCSTRMSWAICFSLPLNGRPW